MEQTMSRVVASCVAGVILLTVGVAAAAQAEDGPILASAPADSELDFKSLKSGLSQTEAIGFRTKLTLKSQLDELLRQVEAYHDGQGGSDIGTLRRQFDALFVTTLDLVREDDPLLHNDLVLSRKTLWRTVRDPKLFKQAAIKNRENQQQARRMPIR